MIITELPSDLSNYRHTPYGWFRRERICAPVPVLAEPLLEAGLKPVFKPGEAREGISGLRSCKNSGNTDMQGSRGRRTIQSVGRWSTRADALLEELG